MAYSKFMLEEVKDKFNLETDGDTELFSDVKAMTASNYLRQTLDYNTPLALAIGTEKARSEFIIAPILAEFRRLCDEQISLFSGVKFNVDRKAGLTGICDFLICRSPEQFSITAPVIVLVEAKRENIAGGIPQCIAEMYAARLFNESKGNNLSTIHGIVTSGDRWKFLKLENSIVYIDREDHYTNELGKILAILVLIVHQT